MSQASVAARANTDLVTSIAAQKRAEWNHRSYGLVVAAGLVAALHRCTRALSDTDVLWGTRFGLDVLHTGRLPRVDTYSWTAHGKTWVPNSWGWNLVLGAFDEAFGTAGLSILIVLIGVGLAAAVARGAHALGAKPTWTAMAVLVLLPLPLFIAPRAQAAALIPMVIMPTLLPQALFGERRAALRSVVALFALQVLWMNIHTSGVLGPVLVAVAGAGLALERRDRGPVLRFAGPRLSALVLVLAVACCLTPYGFSTITHVAEVRGASSGLMQEWLPPSFASPVQVTGVIGTAVGLLAVWFAARARRWSCAAVLALLTAASLTAIRFDPLVAVIAIPEIAVAAARLRVRPHMARRMLAVGVAVLVGMAALNGRTIGHLGTYVSSPRLVAALPSHCRTANDMLIGGAIILNRPDVQVSLDSRNDMYGRTTVLQDVAVLKGGSKAVRSLDESGVDCVLALSGYGIVQSLQHQPGWHVVASDGVRTLVVRSSLAGQR